jgi:predicted amidophosphoribosyltransferase
MMRRLTDALFSALFAPPCAVCARVLDHPLDGAVCASCWNAIVSPARPFRGNSLIARAGAVGEYEGVLRDVIHALKYNGRRSIAPRLAALMALHGENVLSGADAVVPVPLHPRRERERGFNQADDLAHGLGLPVVHALHRTRMTAPQVELPAAARHRNVKDAFDIGRSFGAGRSKDRPLRRLLAGMTPRRQPWVPRRRSLDRPDLAGKILVLVDDVTTTGATLEACADVLKAAGAMEIRALTAARVASALH